MQFAVALPVGLAVGVVLGLLGAGGSLLTVPALIFLLGQTTTQATGTSLVAVALMALSGLVVHQRAERCACREGLLFGGAGIATAVAAGRLAEVLPEAVLTGSFIVVLLGAAVWLVARDDPTDAERDARSGGAWWKIVAAGAGVGALTGLLGVGGGFLVVPALIALRGMPMPLAVGTSQLVVLVNALAGLGGRLFGGSVVWGLGAVFGLGGILGAALGSRVADRMPSRQLRWAFSGVAVVVAAALGWQLATGGGGVGA